MSQKILTFAKKYLLKTKISHIGKKNSLKRNKKLHNFTQQNCTAKLVVDQPTTSNIEQLASKRIA